MVDCIVLAGGLGTRLRDAVPDVPKPLAPIQGVPFLRLLLGMLEGTGLVDQIILALGYKSATIIEHFVHFPMQIPVVFSVEATPLGTGGATKQALVHTAGDVVCVCNGDSFVEFSLAAILQQHNMQQSSITMACRYVEDTQRYGRVEMEPHMRRILSFHEKDVVMGPGWVNAGVYVMRKEVVAAVRKSIFSIEYDLLPSLIGEGLDGFCCTGKFIDIGTKTSYYLAQQELQSWILSTDR